MRRYGSAKPPVREESNDDALFDALIAEEGPVAPPSTAASNVAPRRPAERQGGSKASRGKIVAKEPESASDDDASAFPDSQEALAVDFKSAVRTRVAPKSAAAPAPAPASQPQPDQPVRTYARRVRQSASAPAQQSAPPSSSARILPASAPKPSAPPAAAAQDPSAAPPAAEPLAKASSAPKRLRVWNGQDAPATRHSIGTNREFGGSRADLDDLQYQIDGCGPSSSIAVRKTSMHAVLEQAASAETRLLMRAHGLTANLLAALQGAESDPELQLLALALRYLCVADKSDLEAFDSGAVAALVSALPPSGSWDAPSPPPALAEPVERVLASCGGADEEGAPAASCPALALRTLTLLAESSPAAREELVRGGGLASVFSLLEAAAAALGPAPEPGPSGAARQGRKQAGKGRKGAARSESPVSSQGQRRPAGRAPSAGASGDEDRAGGGGGGGGGGRGPVLRRLRETMALAERVTGQGSWRSNEAGGAAPGPLPALLSVLRTFPDDAELRVSCLGLLLNLTNGCAPAAELLAALGGLEVALRAALGPGGAGAAPAPYDARLRALGLLTNVLEQHPPSRAALAAAPFEACTAGEALARRFVELAVPRADSEDSDERIEAGVEGAYCGLALSWLLRDGEGGAGGSCSTSSGGRGACERLLPLLPGGTAAALRSVLRGFSELHEGERWLSAEGRLSLRGTLEALARIDAARAALSP
eukprot:tig00021108_g18318.t1